MFCRLFKFLARIVCPKVSGPLLQIVFKAPGISIGGNMDFSVSAGATVSFGLQLKPDAQGNLTTLMPGPVHWTVDDDTKALLVPSDDGMTVAVTGTGMGTFVLSVTSGDLRADANGSTVAGVTTGITIVPLTNVLTPS